MPPYRTIPSNEEPDFCQENNIKLIIDTCHAHAQIIWQLAINYATLANIPPFELAFIRPHLIIDFFPEYYV
jgi:precorrin-6x reductase